MRKTKGGNTLGETFDVRAYSVWDAADEGVQAVKPHLFDGLEVSHASGYTIMSFSNNRRIDPVKFLDPAAKRFRAIVEAKG